MSRETPKRSVAGGRLGRIELVAIAVGGMIGGGIFSILGLAVALAGNGAPVSFLIAAIIAGTAAYSYVKLCLRYPDDGASVSYLLHAFPRWPLIATIDGWIVIVGYTGTLALYAYTFGAYGADLLQVSQSYAGRGVLSLGVLIFFVIVNLRGVRTTGRAEDLLVYAKLLILGVFALIGLQHVPADAFAGLPDRGLDGVLRGAALIFVAFEGFQLTTNAVQETEAPEKNLGISTAIAIICVAAVYIALCIVAIGAIPRDRLLAAEEYALAEVAQPVLGSAGRVLVAIAAMFATSSAINATMLGASRMMAIMAEQRMMPALIARRSGRGVPVNAVLVLFALSGALTFWSSLEVIASFSSLTFLAVSAAVAVANWELHEQTNARRWVVGLSLALIVATIIALCVYLFHEAPKELIAVASLYVATVALAMLVWLAGRRRRQ